MAPWLLGGAPLGLAIGISVSQADLGFAGWLTGPLIFAGSAQVAAIDLLDAGAAPLVVIGAVLAINARLFLYGAAMLPHWSGTSIWWRLVAGALLVEPSLAVGLDAYEATADRRRAHLQYLGGALLLAAAWFTTIAAGATLGSALPPALRLDLVIPLFFVGHLVLKLDVAANRRAVTVAVTAAVLAVGAPMHAGPVIAIALGVAAGMRADRGRDEGARP